MDDVVVGRTGYEAAIVYGGNCLLTCTATAGLYLLAYFDCTSALTHKGVMLSGEAPNCISLLLATYLTLSQCVYTI